MIKIFEQALLGLVLKQVAVIELQQTLALSNKKNELTQNIACLINLLMIVEGCNENELSAISSETINDYIDRIRMESLLR
jgi:hypothetical protein